MRRMKIVIRNLLLGILLFGPFCKLTDYFFRLKNPNVIVFILALLGLVLILIILMIFFIWLIKPDKDG